MHNINTTAFYSIYQWAGRSQSFDQAMVLFTSEVTWSVIILMVIFLLFIRPFRTGDAKERLHRLGQGFLVAVSLFVTFCVTVLLKVLVAHPRPFVVLAEVRPLVNEMPFESFPSAHAALTMALAVLVLAINKRLGIILVLFAVIVGVSRLYVGVHYPADIVAGFVIGGALSLGMMKIFRIQK